MWERISTWIGANRTVLMYILVALVSGGGFSIAVVGGDGSTGDTHTLTLGGPGHAKVQLGDDAQRALRHAAANDVGDHDDLRSEAPDDVSRSAIDAARDQDERLAANDQLPLVAPLASPQQRGCVTRQVRNFSTRGGVRPRLFVVHYTVSRNAPGWSDVNAITAFFDSAASQASSNYVVDNEGHCALIVQEASKAWTQATFNPVSISVEIINTGSEPTLAGTAGLQRLGQLISDSTKRWEIPLQRGAVSGCVVTRPGIVDHNQLGDCGGGHHDIQPYSVEAVIAAARASRAAATSPLSTLERRLVATVCASAQALKRARSQGSTVSFAAQQKLREAKARVRKHMLRVRDVARATPHGWDVRDRGARYQLLGRAYRGMSC